MRKLVLAFLLVAASTARAASEYPPHYQWQTLESAHFLVHFHQGEEELAQRAAAIAEDVHVRLVPMMKWTPRAKTHLVLSDHVDVSNGSATPFPLNRIEVYVSAPGGDPTSPIAYYDDWLDLVITHEYAHILHLDQAHRIPRLIRTVFGRNPASFPNAYSPLWMTEGLATFVESEVTQAGRVKGTYLDMVLRAAAEEGRWPTEAQASGLTPYWPGGSARYLFGGRFLTWVARKHGVDKLARYFNEYSGRLIPFLHNRNARQVFGASISELWSEWSREQQAAYAAEAGRVREAGLSAPLRVTALGYETRYPLLSPDGRRLAYSHRGPYERPSIRVFDVTGKGEIATHAVHTTSSLSWSPDGTSIAYADLEYHRTFSLLSDLYIWRVGERSARRLTHGARLKHPAFTPDGRALIAVANRAGRNALVEVDVATGAIRTLVAPDDNTQFSDVHVSADRIAVAEWSEGRIDVVTYTRDGRRIANLTAAWPRSTNAAPRFTSDGATILFSSDVTGIANIYSVPAAGGEPRRVTNVIGGAFFPTSVDGTDIYFADYHANGFDVARVDGGAMYSIQARQSGAAGFSSPNIDAGRRAEARRSTGTTTTRPYSALRSLAPRWWAPIFSDETIGATTSGGDVLGFHTYTATVTNDGHALVYNYDRLYPTFTFATLRYDDDVVSFNTSQGLQTYTETDHRLLAQVSMPWRRFDRQVVGYAGAVRDRISGTPPPFVGEADLDRVGVFRGTLQGLRGGVIFNSARQFGFSVSHESGMTARLDYENLSRVLGSDRTVQQLRADVRGYLPIPLARSPLGRHLLAARVAAGNTTGDYIFQRELRVGGTGSGEFLGLESRNFPVRGYDTGTLRGYRAALASAEYRLPLWQIDRGPSTWPIFFNRLVGAAFADAGTAWQRDGARRTIASVGAEVGLDLFLSYVAPLRYRMGVAYLLNDPGRGELQPYVALETSF
ncbi:MAG TPA: hypothetical protein VF846_12410 [Thermoanaerobaculia bacterium]